MCDDEQLIRLIAARNHEAFQALYQKYSHLFYGWAFSRLDNEEAADDVMQDFWIGIWNNPSAAVGTKGSSVKDNLLRQLSFRLIDYLRKQSHLIAQPHNDVERKADMLGYAYEQTDVEFEELKQCINEILETMPKAMQRVYRLRIEQGYSGKDTARELHISESAVYNYLSEALRRLRRGLKHTYNAHGKLSTLIPILLNLL